MSAGDIKVTISDTTPQVITFPDDTTARGDEALAQLSQSRELASFLESHLVETGKQLGLDPKYLKKVRIALCIGLVIKIQLRTLAIG